VFSGLQVQLIEISCGLAGLRSRRNPRPGARRRGAWCGSPQGGAVGPRFTRGGWGEERPDPRKAPWGSSLRSIT